MSRSIRDRSTITVTYDRRDISVWTMLREVLSSSPGKLLLVLGTLIVIVAAAGFESSSTVSQRITQQGQILSDAEPLSNASQVLYSSLSVADAAANTSFITQSSGQDAERERYFQAITTAGHAIVTATAGLTTGTTKQQTDLTIITTELPLYTGLVERAQTNLRSGNPVGSAYMAEASDLMQQHILPAAERMYRAQTANIHASSTAYASTPYLSISWLILAVICLLAANWWLRRRTHRRWNLGIVVAAWCMTISAVWLLLAGLYSAHLAHTADSRGYSAFTELTNARIGTQKARSDETLTLVRRGDEGQLDTSFTTTFDDLTRTLKGFRSEDPHIAEQVNIAKEQLGPWSRAHSTMLYEQIQGDFTAATNAAVGDTPTSSRTAYNTMDSALVKAIDLSRKEFRDNIYRSQAVMNHATKGFILLTVLGIAALIIGFFPRVREYR